MPASKSGKVGIFTPPTYKCPYAADMRLWVKEAWAVDEGDQPVVFYRASDHETCGQPWQSARLMPQWASRLTVVITEIRAERAHNQESKPWAWCILCEKED